MLFRKIIVISVLAGAVLSFMAPLSQAQTVLPKAGDNCAVNNRGQLENAEMKQWLNSEESFETAIRDGGGDRLAEILGCAVKRGRIRFYMVPFFITYLIRLLIGVAGLIAVLFMVIGGYKYVVGGITEDKESGKKTITHALIGLVVALSAWIVINFIQVALTS